MRWREAISPHRPEAVTEFGNAAPRSGVAGRVQYSYQSEWGDQPWHDRH